MRLSIIIPVYNVSEYLEQCINSVINQELKNIEIICVNDGSTDGSRDILENYKRKYPELIILDKENGGLSEARNSGLLIAKGEYIYFLDSDDYLYLDVIGKMLDFVENNNLEIGCFNVLKNGSQSYFDLNYKVDGIITGTEYCKMFYKSNGFCYPSPVWMYLYNHEFLTRNKLHFIKNKLHEDEEFTPKALYYSKRVALLNFPIQYHRVLRPDAITSSITVKHLADTTSIARILYSFFKSQQAEADNIFYEAIYLLYFLTLLKAVENNLLIFKDKFISDEDFVIMKKCSQNEFQLKCAKVASISVKLFYKFYHNNSNIILRKLINRFL